MRCTLGLGVVAGMAALIAGGGAARAQTQIKPRVMLMLDTSGSMTEHINNNNDSRSDGSTSYTDGVMTRSVAANTNAGLYPGNEIGAAQCPAPANKTYDGVNSRLFNGKAAITNVINGAGDVDWGLMRYMGFDCPLFNTFTLTNGNCASDDACNLDEFCVGGKCGLVNNLCVLDGYGGFDRRGGNACGGRYDLPVTYGGACAVGNNAGTTACANAQTCFTDANCNNATVGSCVALGGSAANACRCGGAFTCGAGYTCTAGFCVYNNGCENPGGQILVDPAAAGFSSFQVLPFVDGVEDYNADAAKTKTGNNASIVAGAGAGANERLNGLTGMAITDLGKAIQITNANSAANNGFFTIVNWNSATSVDIQNNNVGGPVIPDGNNGNVRWTVLFPRNPELRAITNTPLAGTARTATNWYKNVIGADTKSTCRPYVLVQITDGFDTCDADANAGPVAAAQSFVAATIPGAKTLNKVYVVGLNLASPTLDAIAAAGGTGTARLATSQTDIEAALADIVSSSVLVEKCNGVDDNCDGQCDESFPDVAVVNVACSNRHSANACDNGALAGTHCFATGNFVCSADTLSEVCSAATCATNPALCPVAETCNGQDDDCNGVIDDCTPFVPGSCCAGMCPACNPTGVPQPETCNGCDDDCDGIIDDHLTDTGLACGSNVGDCTPGATQCCNNGNPATCATHVATDRLTCVGGTGPVAEICDGTDHDCNGIIDDISRTCYPFPTGTPGVGACRNGTQLCNAAACGTAPNGCCPPGWPAGKPCPGASSFGACSGAVGPSPEVCNGQDDDCNGTVDNNVTDIWINTPCCPTGNNADCTNTGTGTRCRLGMFVCSGGAKTCMGGVAKSPETCNGIDDDCNGPIDDAIPGNGSPCTGAGLFTMGPCRAAYQCTGAAGPGPNGLTCVQTTGPMPEICNGADDDCDGTPDDNLVDPRVGVVGGSPCVPLTPLPGTSFPAAGPAPPCNPGTTACVNGAVVCQGEVLPMPNQCNGISTDCTGMTNTNGNCPSGFLCYQGNCYTPCSSGEFPCPGGFVCLPAMNVCIPDACAQQNCPPGQLCNIDNNGNAVCSDPCMTVTCPTGFKCKLGACVDDTCKTNGCPTGQICVGTPPACQPDPCFNVMCPTGSFCNNGMCTMTCTNCPSGEVCINGACTMDPCKGISCGVGEVCAVVAGVGMCVPNMCGSGCGSGLACCGGACMNDPCTTTACPSGTVCKVDVSCSPNCADINRDEIVGAGGGGFSCAMGGEGARGEGWLLALLLIGMAIVWRRRAPSGGDR